MTALSEVSIQNANEEASRYTWARRARPNPEGGRSKQLPPPGDWFIWYIEAGRGWGKGRAGSEFVRWCVEDLGYMRGGIVGPTISTTRNVMVDGPSGILACCPPWNKPAFKPSTHKIVWPNGAEVEVFSAEDEDRLRGANLQFGWCDEFGTWSSAAPFSLFLLCVRIGPRPRVCVTGTPKPLPHVKAMKEHPSCVITKGSTYENREHLSKTFFDQIVSTYEGTRLGRQEIYGEILDDTKGALWKSETMIEAHRVTEHPPLQRIVVAVDPQAGASGETGIVVMGTAKVQGALHGYVLEDCTLSGSPDEWGKAAVAAYNRHRANVLVYEKNQGGDMVLQTLRLQDRNAVLKDVWASRGKFARAEPIAALAEQGRIHHVGMFGALEAELTTWVPGGETDDLGRKVAAKPSPNRLDAMVWAATHLMLGPQGRGLSSAVHNIGRGVMQAPVFQDQQEPNIVRPTDGDGKTGSGRRSRMSS
jgi:phage terminase large subunit-like protein